MARRSARRTMIAGAAVAGLVLVGTGGLASARTNAAQPSWPDLRAQFDYKRTHISVVEHGVEHRDGAAIHDITYSAPGQDPVTAYLVTPDRPGRFAAAMFLHWLGEVNADRTEFLDEAVGLAGHGRGIVSLLPDEVFPFAYGPVGDIRDHDSIVKQVVQLRRGLDLLDQLPYVRSNRIGVVGHDYGGMYASIIGAVDRDRVRSEVVMAADATWVNWFITFFIDVPADQVPAYTATLTPLDPTTYLAHGPAGGSLLQYATDDFFIPNDLARSIGRHAGPHSTFRTYDTDHELALPAVKADRDRFLVGSLTGA